jgi:hopanoid biosynthesis associated RND transporter like protein HpnN
MRLTPIQVPLVPRPLAPLLILALLVLAVLALVATAQRITINTDTADMISADLPFRAAYERYREAFPAHVDMLAVVVDAPTPEGATLAARQLATRLTDRPDLYQEVFLAGDGAWFERNALLWSEPAELDELAERLVSVQPLLGLLTADPTLQGFARTLERALPGLADDNGELGRLLAALDEVIEAELAGRPGQLSWQQLLIGGADAPEQRRRYLFVKPVLDFGQLFPAEPGILYLRESAAALDLLRTTGATVRVTGDAALGYEELESASSGAGRAGIAALIMVTGVLWLALRSFALVLATLVTLIVGLALTAGFATLAIGQLNLISIAFAVLYIGLAVDYGIHLSLRYRELLAREPDRRRALHGAVNDMAGSLALCAVSTAAGFYAFLPTAFTGVSELGLIAGTGMFINLGLSLFLLPSLLLLLPAPPPQRPLPPGSLLHTLSQLPVRQAPAVRGLALGLAVAGLLLLPQLGFDRNPLNLRDPDSESVATLQALLKESPTPPLNITVTVPGADAAAELATRLRALPEVRDVVTLADILPQPTPGQLAQIEELDILLGGTLQLAPATPAGADATVAALEDLRRQLSAQTGALVAGLAELLATLESLPADSRDALLLRLEQRLLGWLPMNLELLARALEAPWSAGAPPPAALRARWENADGLQRLAVYAREDINDNAALRRFVEAVQGVAPEATDEPVLSLRAGDAVVAAFTQAFALALALITLILFALFREARPVLLIITPLLLAALATSMVMALASIPFNFANVIALPLLLGIGVDSGIHMVARARRDPALRQRPLASSTARAVLFSGLTTVCSFGNLLWSSHPGTASMGLVLSVGTALTLAAMLVVLPALVCAPWAWRDPQLQ